MGYLLEKKAGQELLIVAGVGAIVLIFIFIRVKSLESKQYWLLDELKEEK